MKRKILEDIEKAVLETVSNESSDFLDDFLEEMGYDLEKIDEISRKSFKKQAFLLKGKLNYMRDQKLIEQATTQFIAAINANLEKPVAYLKGLILENKLGVQYRNLDKLGPEEIKEIIKDQNLLEVLEMLDGEDQP